MQVRMPSSVNDNCSYKLKYKCRQVVIGHVKHKVTCVKIINTSIPS